MAVRILKMFCVNVISSVVCYKNRERLYRARCKCNCFFIISQTLLEKYNFNLHYSLYYK